MLQNWFIQGSKASEKSSAFGQKSLPKEAENRHKNGLTTL